MKKKFSVALLLHLIAFAISVFITANIENESIGAFTFIVVFLAFEILLGSFGYNESFNSLRRKVEITSIAKYIILAILLEFSSIFIAAIYSQFIDVVSNGDTYSMNMLGMIETHLLYPVVEELFFRGLLMNGFLNRYSVKTSIILQAIIFALAHGINLAPIILLTGVVLGICYWITENIIVVILMHIVMNISVSLLSILTVNGIQPWIVIGLGVISIIGVLLILIHDMKMKIRLN